jgi:hypothetical protein
MTSNEARIQHGWKGFQITFENGYTISVQYGKSNYCERRDLFEEESPADQISSKNCEIAVWKDRTSKWEKMGENEDPVGFISFERIPQIMSHIQQGEIEKAREVCRNR